MNARHLFLVEFVAITMAASFAMFAPRLGLPFILLLIAVFVFLRKAKQDRPESVQGFIWLAGAAMFSMTFNVPQKWLLKSSLLDNDIEASLVTLVQSVEVWRISLFLFWCVYLHFLLRRYRFTMATAQLVRAGQGSSGGSL